MLSLGVIKLNYLIECLLDLTIVLYKTSILMGQAKTLHMPVDTILGRRVSSISFFIWRKQVCIISSPLRSQRPNHRNLLLFTDKLTNFRIYLVVLQIKTMHSSQYTHLIHIEFCLYSTFSLVINSGCHKPISFLHNVPYLYVGPYMIHEHNVTSNESTFNKLV